MSKKTAPRTCKKCGKPIEGEAAWVQSGAKTASGPYHPACKPK
jgi:hypothetical protein